MTSYCVIIMIIYINISWVWIKSKLLFEIIRFLLILNIRKTKLSTQDNKNADKDKIIVISNGNKIEKPEKHHEGSDKNLYNELNIRLKNSIDNDVYRNDKIYG